MYKINGMWNEWNEILDVCVEQTVGNGVSVLCTFKVYDI